MANSIEKQDQFTISVTTRDVKPRRSELVLVSLKDTVADYIGPSQSGRRIATGQMTLVISRLVPLAPMMRDAVRRRLPRRFARRFAPPKTGHYRPSPGSGKNSSASSPQAIRTLRSESGIFRSSSGTVSAPRDRSAVASKSSSATRSLPRSKRGVAHRFYYHHRFDSFLLVQYKRITQGTPGPVYRPNLDPNHAKELKRMIAANKLLRALPKSDRSHVGAFRLSSGPFYVRLCEPKIKSALDAGMVSDMYVPLPLWRRLLKSDEVRGRHGAVRITWDNCLRACLGRDYRGQAAIGPSDAARTVFALRDDLPRGHHLRQAPRGHEQSLSGERDDTMNQRHLECNFLRCRILLTRSAVQRMGLRTMEDIQENQTALLHECNAVFKKALKLLMDDMLTLERLLVPLEKESAAQKQLSATYRYWLRILELAYDSFLWISANYDRSDIVKYYKGPKHGALVHQNIQSVLGLAEKFNEEPDVFAIPLDFSRFACIGDLLRIRHHSDGRVSHDFMEVKEGKVNDEVFEVLKTNDSDRYFEFFDKYGEKGIAQIPRVIKQRQVSDNRIQRMGMQPGIYQEEQAVRLVTEMNVTEGDSYARSIEALVRNARAGTYSVDTIDDCLVLAALDPASEQNYVRTNYVARCVIHAGFADPAATNDQETLLQALKSIEFTDWRSGFGSVLCIPPLLRPLSARCFLDLLFGRIQLHLHFDPSTFLRLCAEAGVRAGFLKKRTTNRLRSRFGWRKGQVPLFAERFWQAAEAGRGGAALAGD